MVIYNRNTTKLLWQTHTTRILKQYQQLFTFSFFFKKNVSIHFHSTQKLQYLPALIRGLHVKWSSRRGDKFSLAPPALGVFVSVLSPKKNKKPAWLNKEKEATAGESCLIMCMCHLWTGTNSKRHSYCRALCQMSCSDAGIWSTKTSGRSGAPPNLPSTPLPPRLQSFQDTERQKNHHTQNLSL